MVTLTLNANRVVLRLTSKMSHDRGWRAACGMTIWILRFHFDHSYDSTRRDGHGRWLWRLVGLVHRGTMGTGLTSICGIGGGRGGGIKSGDFRAGSLSFLPTISSLTRSPE